MHDDIQGMNKRFELVNDDHYKHWQIYYDEANDQFVTGWGRIDNSLIWESAVLIGRKNVS